MNVERLISKHREAVGAGATERQTAHVQGQVGLQILVGGRAALRGPFYLQSRKDEFAYQLDFQIADYGKERFVGSREDVEVGYMRPGDRSPLGDFLHVHQSVLAEGLWGGVLSAAFPLLDPEDNPGVRYRGLKKVEGQKLHRLDYQAKKPQGDLRIQLYFDPETFQHVKSIYDLIRPAPLGADEISSARLTNTRLKLTEEFSEFKDESGLMMPHKWVVTFNSESTDRTLAWEWTHVVQSFAYDVDIDDSVFELAPPR
ncbi:MAG TPA: hypothetical protein VLU25_18100 [Acidobacteriota bacterium]|nr:hypothetical protein [Acidobacteriota bacterium]